MAGQKLNKLSELMMMTRTMLVVIVTTTTTMMMMIFIFSAGRRRPVNLETVLKFVTATETEPVLRYTIHPHIVFDKYSSTCLPTSNTCVNKLTLPVGACVPEDREELFKLLFNCT